MQVEYKSYTHVERIGCDATEGLLNGICYITPKVDGTNACVWASNGAIHAGSRKRDLTRDKDNAGFYNWVLSDDAEAIAVRKFCYDHPGKIVYGEWLVKNQIKDYNEDAWRHLYIFDVYDAENEYYLRTENWQNQMREYGLADYIIPVIAVLDHPTFEQLSELLENNFYLLGNANHPGEGIVIRNENFRNKYGHYVIGKIVRAEFKERKAQKQNPVIEGEIEQSIVNMYVTEAELAKTKNKVCVACDADAFVNTNKMIGMFMSLCWYDLLIECPNWAKKFKNPTVDMRLMQHLVNAKCREYIGL